MLQVIVVPETENFTNHVSHENVVWINNNLGKPDLKGRNASYLAPYWLHGTEGVNRVYHIREFKFGSDASTFVLGNSFALENYWTAMRQHRRFEYHPLTTFGFIEICAGLLAPVHE